MKKQSHILDAKGVTPPDVREMVQDFNDQTLLNPRIKNAVGHMSLSFSPKDGVRMTDALMLDIAKEYMQRMGITDTQYLLVRHLDQPHPHCHLGRKQRANHIGQEHQNPQCESLSCIDREIRITPCTGQRIGTTGTPAGTGQNEVRNIRRNQSCTTSVPKLGRVRKASKSAKY
mgnify:CR=1 FL=1